MQNIYEEIPFGTRTDKFEGAFVWFYARNCEPYKNYPYNDIPNVSLVLSELRWDGMMGAVGGAVEDDDISLEEAVRREAIEEIGYDLNVDNLKPLATIKNIYSGAHNHSYSYEVTYEELQRIHNNASTGIHFSAENSGVNLLHICKYKTGSGTERGYNIILEQKFVGTSKLELQKLVKRENLLVDYFSKD